MSEKIINLHPKALSWRTLLHQVLEREDVDAVVMVVRVDGGWQTAWGSDQTHGDLCTALVKLQYDVMQWVHDDDGC